MMTSALRTLITAFMLLAAFAAQGLQSEVEPFVPLEPLDVHAETSINLVEQLERHHYVRRTLNDTLSSEIFDRYLEMLDPQKVYLLASDREEFEQYRYMLDEALHEGDLEPAFQIFNRYQKRQRERLQYMVELLDDGVEQFDFSKDETLQTDRSEAPWVEGEAAMNDLWRRRLKSSVLAMRLDDRETEDIQETLERRYSSRLHRVSQVKPEDAFQLYMNAVALSYDPHTQYFSPRTSENFNINMSLSLEGIGAVLRSDDEYTTVVRLVPAGPADKSDLLHPSDHIVGVAQEDEEMVDVVGWRLDDVVDLIRGPAGSKVRLDIIPAKAGAGAQPQEITLTREAVKLEEQSAQKRVLDLERNGDPYTLGVIDIPTFYADFKAMKNGDSDYKSTTRDVRRLITELKEEDGVDGLIIDLRNNGGGSLQEASTLTGLFIKAGPTVQVRSASGRVDLFNDDGTKMVWDGPLAVLVNRLSASASEIFAGAIQDYQRGLVIGGQTFGKGTVQTLIPLNRGQLKLTQAKFYRVSGQSTQHQGVIPDIEFPELYDHDRVGESSLTDALPWDVIRPTRFRREQSLAPLLNMLESRHRSRAESDPEFAYLNALTTFNREQSERTELSLNMTTRKQQQAEDDARRLAIENRRREAMGQEPLDSIEQLRRRGSAAEVAAGRDASEGAPEATDETPESADDEAEATEAPGTETDEASSPVADSDPDRDGLLQESGNILLDFITLKQSVADLGDDQLKVR